MHFSLYLVNKEQKDAPFLYFLNKDQQDASLLSQYITMHCPENMKYATITFSFVKMNDVVSHTVS